MATDEQMQQLADEAIADLKDPLAAIGRLNEKVARLEATLERAIGELTNVDASLQERAEAAKPGLALISNASCREATNEGA